MLVVAPPGAAADVRAVTDAIHSWSQALGEVRVQVAPFEEVATREDLPLAQQLDAKVDVGLALFGVRSGAMGGGRVTEVVDALTALGKPIHILRSVESFPDDDSIGALERGRIQQLHSWVERQRERGRRVHEYRNLPEAQDLACLAVDERLSALYEDRPTGPTRNAPRTAPRAPGSIASRLAARPAMARLTPSHPERPEAHHAPILAAPEPGPTPRVLVFAVMLGIATAGIVAGAILAVAAWAG